MNLDKFNLRKNRKPCSNPNVKSPEKELATEAGEPW